MSYTRQELAALDREELEKIFCSVMGVEGFMPYQYEVIAAMLRGEDVMAVMPTGSGKSACFQFLAAVSEGVTIVVEPITALMEDQVRRAGALSIPAQILSRSISAQKVKSVLPEQKLLFLSPETLTHPKFMALAREHLPDISMLVVDEAHCIPLWGASFRPAFLRISGFFRTLGRRVQTAAFTATSTPGMELQIKLALGMEEPFELRRELDPDSQRALFEMTGLDMQVVQISDRYYEQTHYLVLHDLLLPDKEPKAKGKQYLLSRAYKAIFPKDPSQSTDLPESTVNSCRVVKRWLSLRRTYDRLKKAGTVTEKAYHRYRRRAVYAYEDYRRRVLDKAMLRDKYQRLVSDLIWSCGHFEEGSKIIVYCTLRRTVDLLWERLSSEEELLSRGIGVLRYHAGMEGPEKRSSALDLAEKPECRVMLATIAFGMGIDNKDVRMVINYEFPHDVESYYQEIGRAGRDDRPAASLLYFYRPDIKRLEKIADNRKRSDAEGQSAEELLREAQRDLSGKRLREMLAVADSGSSSVETDRLIQHFLGAEDGDQPLSEDMRTVCSSPGSLYMNVCLPAYRILRGEYEPGRPEECVLGSSEKSPRVSFTLEGERIGWLDMMLANAVYTLYFGGDPEADPEKLFALLNGTVKASLTGEDREEILGRLRKMAAAVIEISWGERRFQGRFLPLDEEDGRLLCRETPPLFAYAEADGRRFFSVELAQRDRQRRQKAAYDAGEREDPDLHRHACTPSSKVPHRRQSRHERQDLQQLPADPGGPPAEGYVSDPPDPGGAPESGPHHGRAGAEILRQRRDHQGLQAPEELHRGQKGGRGLRDRHSQRPGGGAPEGAAALRRGGDRKAQRRAELL